MNFGEPVWEDIVKPIRVGNNTKPILAKDWDITYSNAGDPYIVFNGNTATFRLPKHHTASDPVSGKVDKSTNHTYQDLTYSGEAQPSLNFCYAYSYSPSTGARICARSWDHYIKIPTEFSNVFRSDSHKGYVLEDVFTARTLTNDKYYIRNANVGAPPCDSNVNIAPNTPNYEKFNKTCESLDAMGRNFNNWISGARGEFIDSHDLFNIYCGTETCEVTGRDNILNFYMPPRMSTACGPDGCTDDNTLYPDLTPGDQNSGCKRGYNWGVLDANTMWTAKTCGGVFVDRKGNQTSCDRPECNVKDPSKFTGPSSTYSGDCMFPVIKCDINAAVAGSGLTEPSKKQCIDAGGAITPADEHNLCGPPTCYLEDRPICSTGVTPVCNSGKWECPKLTDSSEAWSGLLMVILILIIAIAIVVIQRTGTKVPLSAIS